MVYTLYSANLVRPLSLPCSYFKKRYKVFFRKGMDQANCPPATSAITIALPYRGRALCGIAVRLLDVNFHGIIVSN